MGQVYNDYGDKSNNHLHRVHDQMNSALYEIIGRPKEKGELGGQAHVRIIMISELAKYCCYRWEGPFETKESWATRRTSSWQSRSSPPIDAAVELGGVQIAARGGVCAPKFEARESEEMTIAQSQQIQVSPRSSLAAN